MIKWDVGWFFFFTFFIIHRYSDGCCFLKWWCFYFIPREDKNVLLLLKGGLKKKKSLACLLHQWIEMTSVKKKKKKRHREKNRKNKLTLISLLAWQNKLLSSSKRHASLLPSHHFSRPGFSKKQSKLCFHNWTIILRKYHQLTQFLWSHKKSLVTISQSVVWLQMSCVPDSAVTTVSFQTYRK